MLGADGCCLVLMGATIRPNTRGPFKATVLAELAAAKSILDNVTRKEFLPARNKANPFEEIKREYFQNRAA